MRKGERKRPFLKSWRFREAPFYKLVFNFTIYRGLSRTSFRTWASESNPNYSNSFANVCTIRESGNSLKNKVTNLKSCTESPEKIGAIKGASMVYTWTTRSCAYLASLTSMSYCFPFCASVTFPFPRNTSFLFCPFNTKPNPPPPSSQRNL